MNRRGPEPRPERKRRLLPRRGGEPSLALRPRIRVTANEACGSDCEPDTLVSMSVPLAYLLTWTCYGTWRHGEERGWVDDGHNTPGSPYVPENVHRARWEKVELRHAAVELKSRERQIVTETIAAHCLHRGWELLALNVRSNHVHAVVVCGELSPEEAMVQLKAWSTRRLREAGCVAADAQVWTKHGSTRYLWNDKSVAGAVAYVLDGQGDDLP